MDYYQYVALVNEAFRNEPEKFAEFINLANNARYKRINEASASIARMIEIVKGHRNLLIGLKELFPEAEIIIPPEVEVEVEVEVEAEKLVISNCMSFLNKVKTRFERVDTHVYNSVLLVLHAYRKKDISVKEVREEVINLLYYHEDLIDDFLCFFN